MEEVGLAEPVRQGFQRGDLTLCAAVQVGAIDCLAFDPEERAALGVERQGCNARACEKRLDARSVEIRTLDQTRFVPVEFARRCRDADAPRCVETAHDGLNLRAVEIGALDRRRLRPVHLLAREVDRNASRRIDCGGARISCCAEPSAAEARTIPALDAM